MPTCKAVLIAALLFFVQTAVFAETPGFPGNMQIIIRDGNVLQVKDHVEVVIKSGKVALMGTAPVIAPKPNTPASQGPVINVISYEIKDGQVQIPAHAWTADLKKLFRPSAEGVLIAINGNATINSQPDELDKLYKTVGNRIMDEIAKMDIYSITVKNGKVIAVMVTRRSLATLPEGVLRFKDGRKQSVQ